MHQDDLVILPLEKVLPPSLARVVADAQQKRVGVGLELADSLDHP